MLRHLGIGLLWAITLLAASYAGAALVLPVCVLHDEGELHEIMAMGRQFSFPAFILERGEHIPPCLIRPGSHLRVTAIPLLPDRVPAAN